MKSKTDYYEKLKDPRWQRKRLRILERDEWRCKACLSEEKTLHVHHLFYLKGLEPWDIPDGFLITLCNECHSNEKEPDEECGPVDSIVQDIGTLLDSIWKARYETQEIIDIAYAIHKAPRPPGPPAWTMELRVIPWKWDEDKKRWYKPNKDTVPNEMV